MVEGTPGTGSQLGRFRLDRQIGMGGMGLVYAATDLSLGRRVAVKVMSSRFAGDERLLARFQRESATLARLDSPHVIVILDHGVAGGSPYIVTQHVGGGDLGELVASRGPLPPTTAAGVCAQVASALADAHGAGVIHRDIKPSNVLVADPDAEEPYVYLCDFGIAHTGEDGLTAPGAVAGTWEYLAPELAEGRPPTPASDVYALGCLLWACLTGEPPYTGSEVDVAVAHRRAPVPQLTGNDTSVRRLNGVLRRCLAKHPGERYADVRQARTDLEAAATGVPGRATAGQVVRRPAVLVVVLAVLLGLGTATALAWPADDPPPITGLAGGPATARPAPQPDRVEDATGDLDGDGRGDLRAYWSRAGAPRTALTWHHDGSAMTGPARVGKEARTTQGARGTPLLGDLDGDDDPEVFSVRSRRGTPVVSTGTGGERHATRATPVPGSATPAVGDFDGDGDDDLALAGRDADGFGVWVLPGAEGRVGPAELWYRDRGLHGDRPVRPHPGDFDGDGDADLVLEVGRSRARVQLRLLRSADRSLAPGPRTVLPARLVAQRTVFTGDPDGDDTDELLIQTLPVYASGGQVVVVELVADGDGFTRPSRWVDVSSARRYFDGWSIRSVVIDVNGDGRDDLARVGGPFRDEHWLVDVLVSDGQGFRQPTPAHQFRCGGSCDLGSLHLLGPTG